MSTNVPCINLASLAGATSPVEAYTGVMLRPPHPTSVGGFCGARFLPANPPVRHDVIVYPRELSSLWRAWCINYWLDTTRCIRVLGFFAIEMESSKVLKSATEKRNPKKHLSLLVAIDDRTHANRISRPKIGASLLVKANVNVTAKRLDYCVGITNCERSFGSKTQLRFLTATVCSHARNWIFFNFGCEHANAPIMHLNFIPMR